MTNRQIEKYRKALERQISEVILKTRFAKEENIKLSDIVVLIDDGFCIEIEDSYVFNITYGIDHSPHCCGTKEIGYIEILDDFEELGIIIKDSLIIEGIKLALLYSFNEEAKGKRVILHYFTIPTKDDVYKIFGQAALLAGYQKVGVFTNANSGNKLEHYVKYK